MEWTTEMAYQVCREEAVTAGIPAWLGEACGRAEGGMRITASRIASKDKNETEFGLALMAEIERAGIDTVSGMWDGSGYEQTGREAWDKLMARCWPDVSFGPGQITVQHGDAFGDGSASYENVRDFRNWTLDDPRGSIAWAMRYLASKYRPDEFDPAFKALCRYNWPGGDGAPYSAGVGATYRAALNATGH